MPRKLNFLHLTDDELDRPIYRIMKQKYVFKLFQENRNSLSQVHVWKDKFENFQLAIGGILDGKRFEYGFKNDFGGQCWTREYLSEAMWGIYANDPKERYLRMRSTPRRLLTALVKANPSMPHETCFVGKVKYKTGAQLKAYLGNGGSLQLSSVGLATSLLLKRRAFRHESEVRLLRFGNAEEYDEDGRYYYPIDPHAMITQIMADPHRDRAKWNAEKAEILRMTGFTGKIKRSKAYDAPDWSPPNYISNGAAR